MDLIRKIFRISASMFIMRIGDMMRAVDIGRARCKVAIAIVFSPRRAKPPSARDAARDGFFGGS
ncbi:hypothetical protein [Bradyrhizobium sp. STM 3809]|uniref:hypothetical protein n=1 Tax=Bradyrhizobium sp. STM 3809 TaxID=551936 RepID=UPI001111D690|nr:hypothetical protein [Bradyrhizobium sp. STM 3809]